MDQLAQDPILGHITTFGGHPVSCAAGMAGLQALLDEKLADTAEEKGTLFRSLLVHEKITEVHQKGLWLAVVFDSFDTCKQIIDRCIAQGVLTDWFLFAPQALRISPPLTITEDEIRFAADIILKSIG